MKTLLIITSLSTYTAEGITPHEYALFDSAKDCYSEAVRINENKNYFAWCLYMKPKNDKCIADGTC